MTAFIWKGDEEEGAEFCSLFGLTFPVGVPVDCGHMLPHQIGKLRRNPYFREVPEQAREPKGTPEQDERAALKAMLDRAGIPYDKRWGVERLKATLHGVQESEGVTADG